MQLRVDNCGVHIASATDCAVEINRFGSNVKEAVCLAPQMTNEDLMKPRNSASRAIAERMD